MKKLPARYSLLALAVVFALSSSALANAAISGTFLIDSFDRVHSGRKYQPFRGEAAMTSEGYGVYYDMASIRLSHERPTGTDGVLRVEYQLPLHFSWGNWTSIRREFDFYSDCVGKGVYPLLDLSEYDGLELEFRFERQVNTVLRITLSDVMKPEDVAAHGADEMWWFDLPASSLTHSDEWSTARAPFTSFRLSHGGGVRHNDFKLDLSKITAYEINVISRGATQADGVLLLNRLSAYKLKK